MSTSRAVSELEPTALEVPITADFALEPVFKGRRKLINDLGIVVWVGAFLFFWTWWLQVDHIHTLGRYLLVTAILVWITLVPAYFIFIFAGARIPVRDAKFAGRPRVAMVVTKAPSEPFSIVRETLEGALRQVGPRHDTWLADEDPDREVLEWCKQNGVHVSCRKSDTNYHQLTWPRRTHCKEGNLAYFYDHFGYDRYDFVSQFDADHVPSPDYLRHALAPFSDPGVGYVSAPSICDSNADKSWSARGRLFVEASMHGALQSGYNSRWAPLCIGSHYTVRTAALRAIGGLGPELAEDHSTTLMFAAHGWRGIHAVDAIAHGEGPETFAGLVLQEFQWSRSLVTILLKYTPGYLANLPPRLRFQFLFSELWYPMFSMTMALMYVLPFVALATGFPFVNVTYIDFAIHMLPLSTALLVLAYWWRSTGLFRPVDAPIISWEGIAFLFLRWPWALAGSLAAVWDRLTATRVEFRITPKGKSHKESVPFRLLAPYLALAIAAAAFAFFIDDAGMASGFYIVCLGAAMSNVVLVLLILYRHARENDLPLISLRRSGIASTLCIGIVVALAAGGAYRNGPKGLAAMNVGIDAFALTQTVFSPAGAGNSAETTVYFRPRWRGFRRPAEIETKEN